MMSLSSDSSSSSDSSGCPSRVYYGDTCNQKNHIAGNRQRHRPPWQPQNVTVQSFCPSPPRIPQIPNEIEFCVYSRIEEKPPSPTDASATGINETPVICFPQGGQNNTSSSDDTFLLESVVQGEPPPSTSSGRPSSPQRLMVTHSPKKRPPSPSLSQHCPHYECPKCSGEHKIARGHSQRSQRLFCVGFVGGEELSNPGGRSVDMLSLINCIDAAMKRIQCQSENTAVVCCSNTSEPVCRAAFCWAQRNQRPAFLVTPPVAQNDFFGSEDIPFGVLKIECAEGNEVGEYMGLVDAAIQVGDSLKSRSQLDVFREQKPDGRIIGVDT